MNMEKVYYKLVRDNIPQIIKESGKEPIFRVLNDIEYRDYLFKKDIEELCEVKEAVSVKEIKEELADKIEIIRAMAKFNGLTLQEIIEEADNKRNRNGGFDKKLLLEKVIDK